MGDRDVVTERNKRVTIYDVAKAAHVAASTVSRALNRPGRTNPYTAEHVHKVALELGYIREETSCGQPRADTNRLAVLTNYRSSELIRSLTHSVSAAQHQLLLVDASKELEYVSKSCNKLIPHIDGFLVDDIKTNLELDTMFTTLPTVLMSRVNSPRQAVIPDVEQGFNELLNYLKDLGHSHISYLYGQDRTWTAKAFLEVAKRVSQRREVELHLVGGVENSLDAGRQAVSAWKTHLDSAVITYGNLPAIGFMQELSRSQVEIPRYVSVVGIGDAHSGLLTTPQLTTLEIPHKQIGVTAVNLLVKQISLPWSERKKPVGTIKVPMRLIRRESTGRLL